MNYFEIGSKVFTYLFEGDTPQIFSYEVESCWVRDDGSKYSLIKGCRLKLIKGGYRENGSEYRYNRISYIEGKDVFGSIEELLIKAKESYYDYAFYKKQEIERLGFNISKITNEYSNK